MMRKTDGSRIEFVRVAKADRERGELKEVRWEDIGRGFEIPGGSIVLSDDELESLKGDEKHKSEIVTFAKASEIPPLAIDKSYHVKPAEGGEKGYALLHNALVRAGKVGVLRFAMRDTVHLAILSPDGEGYLVLSQLHWGSEVTRADFAAPAVEFSEKEDEMADNLIESLTEEDFDFAECRNEYAERLEALMIAKAEAGPTHRTSDDKPVTREEADQRGTDLMAALEATIQAKRARKSVA